MRTTLTGSIPPYLGVDLTDRYSQSCRPIDVCGLTPISAGGFSARFWTWEWETSIQGLKIEGIETELHNAKCIMIDGPQGLASTTNTKSGRDCERECKRVSARTPSTRPSDLKQPFAGYICSSLDLFEALAKSGLPISPTDTLSGVFEINPGDVWVRLAGNGLPNKKSLLGGRARRRILESCGVRFDTTYQDRNDDQIDACLAALIAAACEGKIVGMSCQRIGTPVFTDQGILREGPMIIPTLDPKLRMKVNNEINEFVTQSRYSHAVERPLLEIAEKASLPILESKAVEDRGTELLAWLVKRLEEKQPLLISYKCAHWLLFQKPVTVYSQNMGTEVLGIAESTPPMTNERLGSIGLDGFIVSVKEEKPGKGHWDKSPYTEADWVAVFSDSQFRNCGSPY